MVNPVDIGLRIAQALDSIGIKMGSYIGKGSNIKKAMFGGKPTMFKPNALEALRGTGGNFDDALKLIENEAQFIVNATDAEKMAFLNNVNDYKQFGGPLKTDVVARTEFEEGLGSLKSEIEDLQSSTSDLLTTAKSMKADAEKGLKSAEDDLKTFFETGGNPLKKEDKKFLGGSMHEEGQIRTGIRQFLQNELKNGRIKLDSMDTERVMKYFPTIEDDPILVFKKIYGDEAYNKAGSFPGAFEIGEDFNHYRTIFESKMGEDILKVKDKKYVGDGRLLLTESDEVFTPTKFDDDIPFAEGGIANVRPGFVKGTKVGKRIVEEIVEYITSKFTPMDAMKEVNKVIGKTGKYKNLKLTQKDIDDIVEGSNDFIFQRDPDNLFVEGSIKDRTEYLDDADKAETFFPKTSIKVPGSKPIKQGDEITPENFGSSQFAPDTSNLEKAKKLIASNDDTSLEESLKTLEGLGGTKMAERFRLKQKYPGLDDDLLTNIIEDTDPVHKASVLAKIDMAMELGKTNKSADEIIDILKSEPKTKMATGGRAGFYMGGQSGQSVIEPDLSDIGHGSDALMSRTRLSAPGSQATTSTGLNYLLGEDNDNTRIPFNEGLLVPPSKPYTPDMFEKDSMTLLQGMYGTGKDSNEFLYNEMIKKGNILRNQGVERETVIEIIRNNKDKINAFLETQTTTPKSLKGLADGGITELRQGYVGGGGVNLARRGFLKVLAGTGAAVAAFKTGALKLLGKSTTKAAPKLFTAAEGSGAPAWFEGMVNKVLADGVDITKKAATMDGQTVKSLDTPTGKVDVTIDRTGNIDVNYMGDNTAMGEGVDMRYVVGQADETTKVKPFDEFEAVESVPEFQGGNYADGPDLGFGENATGEVKNLYSDVSELQALGGDKRLINDISVTLQKKKTLKRMDENPQEFAQDMDPDVYYDD